MKKDNKQEKAYQTIRARILEGFYVQGQRLVINSIGKELSLSSIPIREAIRRLEAEGLVTMKAYSGPLVATIDENEYFETLSTLAVLEGYAAAFSSTHLSKDEIQQLKEINKQIQHALQKFDFNGYLQLNKEFHLHTIRKCPNESLKQLIEKQWTKLETIRRLKPKYFPTRAIEAIHEHEEIISLLAKKSSTYEIEQFIRKHHLAASTEAPAK